MLTTQLRQPEKARTEITRRIPQPTIAYDKHELTNRSNGEERQVEIFPQQPPIPMKTPLFR